MSKKKIAITPLTPLPDCPEWMSPQQFAAKLGLAKNTVYYALRENRIPHRRFGWRMFIHRSFLEAEAAKPMAEGQEVGV